MNLLVNIEVTSDRANEADDRSAQTAVACATCRSMHAPPWTEADAVIHKSQQLGVVALGQLTLSE